MNNGLTHLYEYITKTHQSFGKLYEYAYSHETLPAMISELLECAKLEATSENILAVLNRLIGLREDTLVQALESAHKTPEEIVLIKRKMYEKVSQIYLDRHLALLNYIEQKRLLDPFYVELLKGVHEIGIILSNWQPKWTKHIIDSINPSLQKRFKTTEEIMDYLRKNRLLEYESNDQEAERSYSVLVEKDFDYAVLSYAKAFEDDVASLVKAFDLLIDKLKKHEDKEFNKKKEWISYFQALKDAFKEEDLKQIMQRWRDVDRKWMQIDTPLQVGHPLEYYEDHYRKAVALEWDVRIANPKAQDQKVLKEQIKSMFKSLCEEFGVQNLPMYEATLSSLDKTQLYIGRPMLYYGAEFNGLFSAQVVPNDEIVSSQWGKKIFAFADNVLDSIRAKPFLKIHTLVFGEEFMDKERRLIFKEPKMWHHVYAVTTIGHEFGHILWVDDSTESVMNSSGVFKNIEEFKATLGGLITFFENDEDKAVASYVLSDTIKRAVGLIAWMKTGEVEPYYCEGLMHLCVLFESGVLAYENEALHVKMDMYEAAKALYKKTYRKLALCYAQKRDAKEFLFDYLTKDADGIYWPKDEKVRQFVAFYWKLHQQLGRSVENQEQKEKWLD